MQKVIPLHQHIGKFRKSNSSFKTAADNIFIKHIVYVDILSDVAQEIQESIVLHPVVVINKFSLSVDKAVNLIVNALNVAVHGFFRDYFTLRSRARISDSSCCTATQKHRMMTGICKTFCHTQRRIMT